MDLQFAKNMQFGIDLLNDLSQYESGKGCKYI